MATATKIPSLDALPVQGVEDDLQTVIQARQKLNAEMVMVEQILAAPSGLSAELRSKMNNIRFHITTALSAIDSYLYMGNLASAPAGDVPNLRDAVANHIQAIHAARSSWDNWLATAKPPEAPAPLPKVGSIMTDALSSPTSSTVIDAVSAPTPIHTYLAIGGVALGALLLWNLLE